MTEFDHPCRETCSGWKQGRERGQGELKTAVDALLKIYDPIKYHHLETDPNTQAGCFQFVAQEALKVDDEVTG